MARMRRAFLSRLPCSPSCRWPVMPRTSPRLRHPRVRARPARRAARSGAPLRRAAVHGQPDRVARTRSPDDPITPDRRTARRTPSSWRGCCASGATRSRSRSTTCCSRRRRRGSSNWWRRRSSPRASPNRRWPGTRVSKLGAEALPTFNMYSADGDVTGDLVYVNYGVPADYEELERRGIDVKGKIVIARYGGSWRGIKPKVAAEHGAIGCLIYSDPRDDGYGQGDVYPKGGWRSEHSAQRGSVADMPVYPGDPLTPGVAATKDAKRPEFTKAQTLTKIPVLPISYGDALPLLKALGGPVAPAAWRGGLPITYHLGPGRGARAPEARVRLEARPGLRRHRHARPASEFPDQWVVRGNHHDGWVAGASDPTSGMVAVLEEARAISAAGARRLAAAAHARLRGVGRRGARPARIHRMGRGPRRGAQRQGRRLHQLGQQRAWVLQRRRVAQPRALRQRDCPRRAGPEGPAVRSATACSRAPSSSGSPGARRAGPRRAALRDRRARLGVRLHAVPAASRHRVARHRLRRRGRVRPVPLDLRLGGPLPALPGSRLAYAAALAKVGGRAVLRLSEADLLPFAFERSAERIGTLRQGDRGSSSRP